MGFLKAQVRNGRLLLDVPSTLPDGSIVQLEVTAVGAPEEAPRDPHGAFDEAEADTAVGPIIAEETLWASLAKPSG